MMQEQILANRRKVATHVGFADAGWAAGRLGRASILLGHLPEVAPHAYVLRDLRAPSLSFFDGARHRTVSHRAIPFHYITERERERKKVSRRRMYRCATL